MQISPLYIFIFIIVLSKSLFAQGKHQWNDNSEIYERLDYHRENLNEDSAIYYADELFTFKSSNEESNGNLINTTKISVLLLFNRNEEALELSLSSLKYCDKIEDLYICENCAITYLYLVDLMIILQDYEQGMAYLKMTCEKSKRGLFYFKKAKLLCLLDEPDKALMITKSWISILKQSNKEKELIGAYNQHGIIARDLKRFDTAISAFSNAIEIVKDNNLSIDNYAYIMGNLGQCFYEIADYDKAYECLLIDSEGSIDERYKRSYISAELALSQIDNIRKDYLILIERLKNLLDNYNKSLVPAQKLEIVELLMNTYKILDEKQAYNNYTNLWIELNRDLYESQALSHKKMISKQATNNLKQVAEKMELEKQLKNQELLILKNKTEQKQIKLFLLIALLVLAMSTILVLFWRYRTIQTKKTLMKESQLDLAKNREEVLKLKVENESMQIKTMSLELEIKKDFSTSLMHQLNQMDNITKPQLRNMELYIKNELEIKSTRAEFEGELESLGGNFYNLLKNNYPNLTNADVKLAAMVAMNMNNKEIGISKNMTSETVRTTKSRLKKKMSLKKEEDLRNVLQQFLS